MIVCHCNVIACTDIRRSVAELSEGKQLAMVTPSMVFKCCGARPQCGGCMTTVTRLISETSAALPK